jgi:lysophospholipase L1-like esterase
LIPSFKTDFSGTGPCGFFDQVGNLLPEKLDGLAGIVREYNGEQARACGEFPQCSTDGGAGARHIEGPEDWSDDGHPNIKGLRRWAELIWPEVERVLAAP